ncbi:uncharacterized protein LOC110039679 [Orbicella faveolata]|uniref:uncharacterized protein LOC110039679 n=1 Tax=Orbicella faveolata TaxID=48498 RepID=UPI0009E44A09|nr:uncharacterized protein LOC110039679 [Orbicella faveolata]
MKIFIFLSLCVTLAWGCSNLPKLAACKRPDGSPDCSCQAGLSCVLTKKLIYQGKTMPVKQCMPEGMDIEVETVDLDNQSADEPMRTKRWLFNSCTSESECQDNFCCAFGKRCSPKLREYFTCYLVDKHNCGCANGLGCKVTTTITLPFGIKIPIKQCVKPE